MKAKRKKTGLPPGSIIYTGSRKKEEVLIHFLQYNTDELTELTFDNQGRGKLQVVNNEKVDWYDVRGMHDTKLIEQFGSTYNIHPLILEDIADIYQRPKYEEYENGVFITFRALHFHKESLTVKTEQVALFFHHNFLLSFQETSSDLFAAVRNRIRSSSGKIRQRGADYLAYALVDASVDQYFVVLDEMENIIEQVESELADHQDMRLKGRIHALRKEMLKIRKSVVPLREAISRFSKSDSKFVHESSLLFIRDLYDHVIQTMDVVENNRDILNGLQELFISEVSFKTVSYTHLTLPTIYSV